MGTIGARVTNPWGQPPPRAALGLADRSAWLKSKLHNIKFDSSHWEGSQQQTLSSSPCPLLLNLTLPPLVWPTQIYSTRQWPLCWPLPANDPRDHSGSQQKDSFFLPSFNINSWNQYGTVAFLKIWHGQLTKHAKDHLRTCHAMIMYTVLTVKISLSKSMDSNIDKCMRSITLQHALRYVYEFGTVTIQTFFL